MFVIANFYMIDIYSQRCMRMPAAKSKNSIKGPRSANRYISRYIQMQMGKLPVGLGDFSRKELFFVPELSLCKSFSQPRGNKDVMTVMDGIDSHFLRKRHPCARMRHRGGQVTTGRIVSPGSSRMQIDAESIPGAAGSF